MHLHSKYSDKPAIWFARKFSIPESYAEPEAVYDLAKERGMTHVTLTDHNNIRGCDILSKYKDTFTSCEVTARFPQDGCKVHIPVYNITGEQYNEIMRSRDDVYELVELLREKGIYHSIAHPFYSVNDKLKQEHFEQLLIMFDTFELNGFRSKSSNDRLQKVVLGTSRENLEEISRRHPEIQRPLLKPELKHFIAGSDDHSGLFVGKSYTENPGNTLTDMFTNWQETTTYCPGSSHRDLAYALYSIAYQNLGDKFGVNKLARRDYSVDSLNQLMTLTKTPVSWSDKIIRNFRKRRKQLKKSDSRSLLWRILYGAEKHTQGLNHSNVTDRFYDLLTHETDRAVGDKVDEAVEKLQLGGVLEFPEIIGSLGSMQLALAPYYVSMSVFADTRKFSEEMVEKLGEKGEPNVAHFTDTFREVNGVALTLRQFAESARKYGKNCEFITCADHKSHKGETNFKPIRTYELPEYPEVSLHIPPILKMLNYCNDRDFTHIHAATPGPVGLVALCASKLLKRPFFTTYHTAFPEFVRDLTGDEGMEAATWQYMRFFYGQADKVFVPSESFRDSLLENGISAENLELMPRGVDLERFEPKRWDLQKPNFDLLYVGRISKEKNLNILAEAFKLLNRDDVRLKVVGDGPYLKELKDSLRGFKVEFPGYIKGKDLVHVYQDADLFVFPSTNDTFGNVILESHACAVPTIVTDSGGPKENVLDGQTGRVVKGNDVQALKVGIESLLKMPMLARMGTHAREKVESCSFESAFLDFWKFYEH